MQRQYEGIWIDRQVGDGVITGRQTCFVLGFRRREGKNYLIIALYTKESVVNWGRQSEASEKPLKVWWCAVRED